MLCRAALGRSRECGAVTAKVPALSAWGQDKPRSTGFQTLSMSPMHCSNSWQEITNPCVTKTAPTAAVIYPSEVRRQSIIPR